MKPHTLNGGESPVYSLEVILDGQPPERVRMVAPPIVNPGCAPGRHCCANCDGPFPCCKCGAMFKPAPLPDNR